MVMSLSLIDDGDDIFNHILYSGGLTILRAINRMRTYFTLLILTPLDAFLLKKHNVFIFLENRSCSVIELRFYTKKSLKLIIKHQPQ